MANNLLKASQMALLAALTFMAIEGGILLRRAQRAVPGVVNEIHFTAQDYRRVAQDTVGVTAQLRKTLKASEDSSKQLVANSAQATATLNSDLAILGTLETNANDALSAMRERGAALGDQAGDTLDEIHSAASKAEPIMETVSLDVDRAGPILDDAKQVSAQGVGIATDTHTETTLIVGQTREAFKPKNKFLSIVQLLAGGTLSGAELFYYLRK